MSRDNIYVGIRDGFSLNFVQLKILVEKMGIRGRRGIFTFQRLNRPGGVAKILRWGWESRFLFGVPPLIHRCWLFAGRCRVPGVPVEAVQATGLAEIWGDTGRFEAGPRGRFVQNPPKSRLNPVIKAVSRASRPDC